MKRVLVTGASGFIGRAVLPFLADCDDYDVHAISRTPVEGVRWHRGDLLAGDAERLIASLRPTHLLHLAWYGAADYWTSPRNGKWLDASRRIVDAFVTHGGERAVFAGTCAEYDWSDGVCSEETTAIAPASIYGLSKDALRRAVEAAPISSAWGRIFFVYGPGELPTRLVPSLIRPLLAGGRAECRHPSLRRDFLHVDDVARAFAMLLDSDARGAVNIGSGEAMPLGELAQRIARLTGGRVVPGDAPAAMAPLVVADVARLRALGVSAEVSLDRGLRETIAWWRERARISA